jgi:alkylated DNA repair protein (DNA oxidative demethylase)
MRNRRGQDEALSLFQPSAEQAKQEIAPGAFLLRGFALEGESALLAGVDEVRRAAEFRNMVTPGGYRMSVAMTNCGDLGWITDRSGYRYDEVDPESGKKWPEMPAAFRRLAESAARESGFADFHPNACLINRYEPGTKLSLHQDKDERDFTQPIVSVSLGIPATFLFGGHTRSDKADRIPLRHGDVVVWGGPARLRYHGVAELKAGEHPRLGRTRVNLTFRKVAREGSGDLKTH